MSNDFDDAKRGLRKLAQVFKKFADQHVTEENKLRVIRSAAAGGKAALGKARQEFPRAYIEQVAADFYLVISGRDMADGVSQTVRSFDAEKVKHMLDHFVARMKEDETAIKLAQMIKQSLDKKLHEHMEQLFDQILSAQDLKKQMMLRMMLGMLKPRIEEFRHSSVEEIAEKIKKFADTIPTEKIALRVSALTQRVTPEFVQGKTAEVVDGLPSPKAVSDIAHDVAEAAAKKLGEVAKARTLADVKSILSQFQDEASSLVDEIFANDNQTKKPSQKKGRNPSSGDFSL
jgi:hypothetical protein